MASYTSESGNLMEQARSQGADTAEMAQKAAGNISEKASEYGQDVAAKAREWWPFVQRSLKDQPVLTLACIAALGFVVGTMARR